MKFKLTVKSNGIWVSPEKKRLNRYLLLQIKSIMKEGEYMFKKTARIHVENPSFKLFEGEKWLVIMSLIGFILSAGIAIYILQNGEVILPEGNVKDAFSFNAAIAMFILSLAAILPLSGLSARKRKTVRWLMIAATLYSYGIETIQNFRGLNPRFSREGSIIDTIGGMLFGVVSLIIVILGLLLLVQFFRLKKPFHRPLLIMGIRYAFLSVLVANIAGIWMILLQDRFTGDSGNLIVLHGISFHAMQTLIVPCWLLERVQLKEHSKKMLLHVGSIAWMVAIMMIGIQTALGRSVFDGSVLSIVALILLVVWFGTFITALLHYVKAKSSSRLPSNEIVIERGE